MTALTNLQIDDRLNVAAAWLQSVGTEWREVDLDAPEPPAADRSLTLHLQTLDLRVATAALESVVLSFDVAAIVVDVLGGDPAGPLLSRLDAGSEVSADDLRSYGTLPLLEVRVEQLEIGSVLVSFSVNPRTPAGRRRLTAILGIGVGIAAFLLPSVAAVTLAAGAVNFLQNLDTVMTRDALIGTPESPAIRSVNLEAANEATGTLGPVTDAAPVVVPAAARDTASSSEEFVRISRDELARLEQVAETVAMPRSEYERLKRIEEIAAAVAAAPADPIKSLQSGFGNLASSVRSRLAPARSEQEMA